MKTKWCLGILLVAGCVARGQTNNLTTLLQQGLFEEQANRNLEAAIADYQTLATQFDRDRQLAATAVFRLGECYRAEGRTNEAAVEYQRILREFGDQQTLATLSRQDLAGMGMAGPESSWADNGTAENPVESYDAQLWDKLKGMSTEELATLLPTLMSDSALGSLVDQRRLEQSNMARMRNQGTNTPEYLIEKELVDRLDVEVTAKIDRIMTVLKLRAGLPPPAGAQLPQKDQLTAMIATVEQSLADLEKVVGTNPSGQVLANVKEKRIELQNLKVQLTMADRYGAGASSAIVSDEDREIARIQDMIQNSPDLINAPGDGTTPLVKAAYNGSLKVAAYLLDHGAGINVACRKTPGPEPVAKVTPLLAAVEAGNKAMTEFLLSRGADLKLGDQDGNTALHLAARRGFQAILQVLLASHADVNARNDFGASPLFDAVQSGNSKIVQMLLAAGADVNLKEDENHKNQTVLNFAIGGPPEIFQALLNAGADPNTVDSDGRTPLSYAVENDPSKVKPLLAAKADPNAGTLDAPLLGAVHKQDVAIAALLLQAGANTNFIGNISWDVTILNMTYMGGRPVSPLYFAVSTKQLSMVQVLLKYKADPNDSQTDGQSPLFSALDHPEIVEALLDAGANANATQVPEGTPRRFLGGRNPPPPTTLLQAAVNLNQPRTVELLLQHGADANARDENGNSPLHYAIFQLADEPVFAALLNHRADPNARNNGGQTPLQVLQQNLAANTWPSRQVDFATLKAHAEKLIAWLHAHGALDRLPDWNHITISRPSSGFSFALFSKGTNDWNQFTLLETIANFSFSSETYEVPQGNNTWAGYALNSMLPFADLTQITIVRPSHGSTNETRRVVNLLNSANEIDVAKDVTLEFGDVIEIPERDHALGENSSGLTDTQRGALANYVKGVAKLTAHGQEIELPFSRLDGQATVGTVLNSGEARQLLLASSDLSRVKVTRRDAKTGQKREWIFDCRQKAASPNGTSALSYQWNLTFAGSGNGASSPTIQDLWLQNGDAIEVPEKP